MSIAATSNYAVMPRATSIANGQDLMNRLVSSPVGSRIVNAYAPYGGLPTIQLVADNQIQGNGSYNRNTNTVSIKASLLATHPEQAVTTLAHELFHGLDDMSGMADWIDRSQTQQNAHLMVEARAYAVASRVQRELGYAQGTVGGSEGPAQAAYGAADLAGGYANAWHALKRTGI